MKIRSAVSENGCLIVLVDGKKTNKQNNCKTHTHPPPTGRRLSKNIRHHYQHVGFRLSFGRQRSAMAHQWHVIHCAHAKRLAAPPSQNIAITSNDVATFINKINTLKRIYQTKQNYRPTFFLSPQNETRMVQLPATAAIEYVAACCTTRTRTRTKTRTKTKTGTKTKIGTITKIVRGPYARSP